MPICNISITSFQTAVQKEVILILVVEIFLVFNESVVKGVV